MDEYNESRISALEDALLEVIDYVEELEMTGVLELDVDGDDILARARVTLDWDDVMEPYESEGAPD
jgi:hypothetical protein